MCRVEKQIRGDRKSKKARTEREEPNEDGWEDHMIPGVHCVCVCVCAWSSGMGGVDGKTIWETVQVSC